MTRSVSQLLRAGAVIMAIVLAVGAATLLSERRSVPQQQPRVHATTPKIAAVTLAEIGPAYQGPIQEKNLDEGWLMLTVTLAETASDPIRFRYTLNGFSKTAKALVDRGDDGELSLRKGTIRFSKYKGRIRRDSRGKVILKSNQIDGPPYWLLEPVPEIPSS